MLSRSHLNALAQRASLELRNTLWEAEIMENGHNPEVVEKHYGPGGKHQELADHWVALCLATGMSITQVISIAEEVSTYTSNK